MATTEKAKDSHSVLTSKLLFLTTFMVRYVSEKLSFLAARGLCGGDMGKVVTGPCKYSHKLTVSG